MGPDTLDMERKVARARVLLSLGALVAVLMDPTGPPTVPWFGPERVIHGVDARVLSVFAIHLCFSLAIYALLSRPLVTSPKMVVLTTGADVFFSLFIAMFTEGIASPFYVFFTFAVVAAGVRSGFRFSMGVTAVCIWLYLSLILLSVPRLRLNAYVVQPVYLAIVGYLVAYLGRQRLEVESKLRGLQIARERNAIARALHDGCVQTLAGTNLTLESCRELVRRGQGEEALAALRELQTSITREYDGLRTYVRELADIDTTPSHTPRGFETRFNVHADFAGTGAVVEHVLNIMLEGVRNVRRHAFARSARVEVEGGQQELRIAVDDDGVGVPLGARPPWSICSRVEQMGGRIWLTGEGEGGAHLGVVLPNG